MTQLTSNMKTVCFGRLLLDVPAEAVFQHGPAKSDSIDITREKAFDTPSFESQMVRREAALMAITREDGGPMLRWNWKDANSHKRVFAYWENPEQDYLTIVEGYALEDGFAWKTLYETGRKFYESRLRLTQEILKSIKKWDGSITDLAPGACMQDGILTRRPDEVENFTAGVYMEKPAWSIDIKTETSGPRAKGSELLDRIDDAIDMAGPAGSGIKKLRRTRLTLSDGRQAQEQITLYPEAKRVMLAADLEAYGDATPQKPTIKMSLEVSLPIQVAPGDEGKYLSQKDALALWDAMVKGIRMRPGAF